MCAHTVSNQGSCPVFEWRTANSANLQLSLNYGGYY